MAGPTLEEMVRGRGPLSGQGLRRLAYGMAEALTAIHAAGVVHRDLKPGNVMLTDDRPIVIDFGIAQTGDATRLTQTGLVMGTPGYLAPEVIEGQPSSPASDVHSWGSTMAFAATGHLPFGGGSYETIFYRIVSGRADLTGVPAPLVPLHLRGAGQGPLAPPVGRLAQRPGQRARHVGGGPGPDRRLHRLAASAACGPAPAGPFTQAPAPPGPRPRAPRAACGPRRACAVTPSAVPQVPGAPGAQGAPGTQAGGQGRRRPAARPSTTQPSQRPQKQQKRQKPAETQPDLAGPDPRTAETRPAPGDPQGPKPAARRPAPPGPPEHHGRPRPHGRGRGADRGAARWPG